MKTFSQINFIVRRAPGLLPTQSPQRAFYSRVDLSDEVHHQIELTLQSWRRNASGVAFLSPSKSQSAPLPLPITCGNFRADPTSLTLREVHVTLLKTLVVFAAFALVSPSARAWSPDPVTVTLPDGTTATGSPPAPTQKEYEDWYHTHTTGLPPGVWPEDVRSSSNDFYSSNTYSPASSRSEKRVVKRKAQKVVRQKAPTPTFWTCLAQDYAYSYDASAADKVTAQQVAIQKCANESDAPATCYSHRCEGL